MTSKLNFGYFHTELTDRRLRFEVVGDETVSVFYVTRILFLGRIMLRKRTFIQARGFLCLDFFFIEHPH